MEKILLENPCVLGMLGEIKPKQSMKKALLFVGLVGWLMTQAGNTVLAAESGLQKGDSVAVIGDSITEQRLYSMYIEDYLLMCQPAADLRVT